MGEQSDTDNGDLEEQTRSRRPTRRSVCSMEDHPAGAFALRSEPCLPRVAQVGDVVVVQERHDCLRTIVLERDAEIQNRFGKFKHNDLIGRPLGRKWISGSRRDGYMHVFPMSSPLWTLALTHRTQVVYTHDIALILLRLEIRSGSVVVEAGTGSTSMTYALANTVQPNGHIYSFDFHESRVNQARKDLDQLGHSKTVTVTHRDVIAEGFCNHDDNLQADAVFLDLPSIHLCVHHAEKVLKPGGHVCFFSPCIEQVAQTKAELAKTHFCQIKTLTCTMRPFDVREEPAERLPVELKQPRGEDRTSCCLKRPELSSVVCRPARDIKGHTSYLTFAMKALPRGLAKHMRIESMTGDGES